MEETKKRITRKPRCLRGQRHRWIMGAALKATDVGTLISGDGAKASHLRGQCRKCGKVRNFHPFAANSRMSIGQMVPKGRRYIDEAAGGLVPKRRVA